MASDKDLSGFKQTKILEFNINFQFQEYLNNLNNLRATLPARLSHLEPAKDSVVRSVVSELTAQYKDLLNRANALSDRLSGVGGRQREFKDALEKARAWLRENEPRASKVSGVGCLKLV